MKLKIFRTREEKLKNKLDGLLLNKTITQNDIDKTIEIVKGYEKNNLDTIEQLKKDKLFDTKKINGALKQTINAHGPITIDIIGSATKRIYGALLTNPKKKTHINIDIGSFTLICISLILLFIVAIIL